MWSKEEKDHIEGLMASARVTADNTAWYKRNVVDRIVENKKRYQEVAEKTGIPTVMVALIHARERSSDLGKFKCYLGNGQPLDQVTTIVPKGRGPFDTWEQGAYDAIAYDKLDKIEGWTEARMFYELEGYNGYGYRNRGVNSPYIWNGTNHYSRGAYVRDGVYDANAVDGNMGCFALYKLICEEDKSFMVNQVQVEPEKQGKDFWDILVDFFSSLFGLKMPETPVNPAEPEKATRNELVLRKAANEIGVKEIAGSGTNKQVEEYLDYGASEGNKDSGLSDATPWCAGFVAWCLEKVGMGSTNSLMARSYEKWGVSSKNDPLPGDIVTFYRNGKSSGSGHVGFFLSESASHVYVLGGNQQDEVNVSRYAKGTATSSSGMTDIRRSSKAGNYTKEQRQLLVTLAQDILNGRPVKEGGKVT